MGRGEADTDTREDVAVVALMPTDMIEIKQPAVKAGEYILTPLPENDGRFFLHNVEPKNHAALIALRQGTWVCLNCTGECACEAAPYLEKIPLSAYAKVIEQAQEEAEVKLLIDGKRMTAKGTTVIKGAHHIQIGETAWRIDPLSRHFVGVMRIASLTDKSNASFECLLGREENNFFCYASDCGNACPSTVVATLGYPEITAERQFNDCLLSLFMDDRHALSIDWQWEGDTLCGIIPRRRDAPEQYMSMKLSLSRQGRVG